MEFLAVILIGALVLLVVVLPFVLLAVGREQRAQTRNPGPAMDRFLDGSPIAVVYGAAFDLPPGEISRLAAERGYEYVQTTAGKIGPEHTFRKIA